MLDGRGTRIALEAGFLVVVAAVLGVADVRPLAIVLVMLLAWAIVALLEWVAWRDEPHWSAGLPPRYYVPQQPLPPRPPSEELPAFSTYPRPPLETAPRLTEAPTWIATPEMREELFGWPTPQPAAEEHAADEPPAEQAAASPPSLGETDPWPAPPPADELHDELLDAASAAAAPEPDVEPAGWPLEDEVDPALDPWFVEAPPVESVVADEAEPAAGEPEPEPVPAPERAEPVAVSEPEPELPRLARHRIDPFAAEPTRRRPWRRRGEDAVAVAELPPLPRHRPLDRADGDGR